MGRGRSVYASESLLGGSVYLGALVDFRKEGYKLYRTIYGQEPFAMMRMEWEVEVPTLGDQATVAPVPQGTVSIDTGDGAKNDHLVVEDGPSG